jgi:hypothetical protein
MFTQESYTVQENISDSISDMVCVQLIGELGISIEVDIQFEESTATADDFSNTDFTLNFTSDDVSDPQQCFMLQTSGDNLFEEDEIFFISLSSSSDNVDVLNDNVIVTIRDISEVTVGFEMSAYNVTEGDTLEVCVEVVSGAFGDQVSLMVNVVPVAEQGITNMHASLSLTIANLSQARVKYNGA